MATLALDIPSTAMGNTQNDYFIAQTQGISN
jgi:hypothetical protein